MPWAARSRTSWSPSGGRRGARTACVPGRPAGPGVRVVRRGRGRAAAARRHPADRRGPLRQSARPAAADARPGPHVRLLGPAARRGPLRPHPRVPGHPLRPGRLAPLRRPARPCPPASRQRAGPPRPARTAGAGAAPVRGRRRGAGRGAAGGAAGARAHHVRPGDGDGPASPAQAGPAGRGTGGGGVMNRLEREAAARRIMERVQPVPPPDLYEDVVRRGSRLLRRRTAVRRLLWLLLVAGLVAFTVWALTVQPWVEPPSDTTPPLTDW
ncbi:hypothetical protein HXP45_11730 [Streptomyces actuosus]|uniref:Uncharacterized protein n=2 Tax=Streptomyces TaxID=1883 RepID=A0A2U9PD17_STRAS|nr:hypothetical protein DMT42_24630 [Streptomyces actuosus]MBM4821743.1 hypothetical protein [Streptomyces actuosus]